MKSWPISLRQRLQAALSRQFIRRKSPKNNYRRRCRLVGLEALEDRRLLAVFTVDSTNDTIDVVPGDGMAQDADGKTTLRAAIMEANANSGADQIILPAGIYELTAIGRGEDNAFSGDLDITDDLTITGDGAGLTIIDAKAIDRVFHILGATVTISGVTIQNGLAIDGDSLGFESGAIGGGILNEIGILTIMSSTIKENRAVGAAGQAGYGGGLYDFVGTLTISNTQILDNQALGGADADAKGGGIYSDFSTASVTSSTLSGNQAIGGPGVASGPGGHGQGGGIYSDGSTWNFFSDSTVSNNLAVGGAGGSSSNGTAGDGGDGSGGGIFSSSSTWDSVSGSTISGNQARGGKGGTGVNATNGGAGGNAMGGGISSNIGDTWELLGNTTISTNSAKGGDGGPSFGASPGSDGNANGGGFFIDGGTVSAEHVTVAANRAYGATGVGGGFFAANFSPTLHSTIVAANQASTSNDVSGEFSSLGYNLIGDANGSMGFGATGDKLGGISGPIIDPKLAPLADNGGPTFTHALLPGSPAIDAGDPDSDFSVDQRGVARPISAGGVPDIGAYEANLPAIAIQKLVNGMSGPGVLLVVGDPVNFEYRVTNAGNVPLMNVVVSDDNGTPGNTADDFNPMFVSGDTNNNQLLDLDETWIYTATRVVTRGEVTNVGTATADDATPIAISRRVSATAESSYTGLLVAVDIEKFTAPGTVAPSGDLCDQFDKPQLLTMRFTGNDVVSHAQDPGKVNVSGDLMGAQEVRILATDKANPSDSKAKIYFNGQLQVDQQFGIDAANAGQSQLGTTTYVHIFNLSGNLLRTIEFHTSCSQPLQLGDQYGGIQLVGFRDVNGASASLTQTDDFGADADSPNDSSIPDIELGAQVVWTYVVTNPGDVALEDVVVRDDNETPGDMDDFFPAPLLNSSGRNVGDTNGNELLDPGEQWLYRAVDIVMEEGLHGNEGFVTATSVEFDRTVMDSDLSHHRGVPLAFDVCELGEKPQLLTMRFTGDDVISHSQDPSKVSVSGSLMGATQVLIRATDKANPSDSTAKIYFNGQLQVDQQFEIDAAAAGQSRLGATTYVHIFSVSGSWLRTIAFHTSCSQPLVLGDRFGGIQLIGFLGEKGATAGVQPPDDGMPAVDVCKTGEKPQLLTMRFTGDDVVSHSQDPSKVSVSGSLMGATQVLIRATDKANLSDSKARIYFNGQVEVGQQFGIDADVAGQGKLEATTYVHIFSVSGSWLRTIAFHTSCSQPLVLGDRFGGIQLIGFLGEKGAAAGIQPPAASASEISTKLSFDGKKVHVDLTNNSLDGIATIESLFVEWASSNKKLVKITIDGAMIFDTKTNPTTLQTSDFKGSFNLRRFGPGQSIRLTFEFEQKASSSAFHLSLDFGDGLTALL